MTIFKKHSNSRLVGISGPSGAGKGVAGDHLAKFGFMHVSTSDVLHTEATRRGLNHERATLSEIHADLRKEYGSLGALVLNGIEQWKEQSELYEAGVVLSGLRVLGDARELKNQNGILLFVDAPVATRHARVVVRNRDTEAAMSVAEFTEHDKIELLGHRGPERPHLRAVEAVSDVVLQNISTESIFLEQLDHIFSINVQ